MPKNLGRAFLHALGVLIYTSAISCLLFNAKFLMGDGHSFLIPVFMLMTLIISATITGLLVLGKPIQLYLNGAKKEAMMLLGYTLGWLILFTIIVVLSIAFYVNK
ncbi:hypothetical protein HY224_03390 [Candidatus Uhrbacteria bacterium]|nr:hypothetical protein [Candidatus Uhrbacteria bacterium]